MLRKLLISIATKEFADAVRSITEAGGGGAACRAGIHERMPGVKVDNSRHECASGVLINIGANTS